LFLPPVTFRLQEVEGDLYKPLDPRPG